MAEQTKRGGFEMSLSEKEYEGRGIKKWYKKEDVKEAIINTQKRLIGELENRKRIHTKKHNRVRTQVLINRIFEEEIGKELCSGIEE